MVYYRYDTLAISKLIYLYNMHTLIYQTGISKIISLIIVKR